MSSNRPWTWVLSLACGVASMPAARADDGPSAVLKRVQPQGSSARRSAPRTATALGPSGVQDIHIALAGLPPAKEIVFISVRPLGGGEWLYKGPHGPWGAALVRQPGSMTADLYVEPSQVERGRRIEIV